MPASGKRSHYSLAADFAFAHIHRKLATSRLLVREFCRNLQLVNDQQKNPSLLMTPEGHLLVMLSCDHVAILKPNDDFAVVELETSAWLMAAQEPYVWGSSYNFTSCRLFIRSCLLG
ncbi:hypothetical protein AVEN_50457-1 [Araneus ventricosus]|uniref:Uncharacterized protein n=1 Tax=Araneus ventricosus TaxID=182803 RepID=A0A4Y2H0U5_ARAVE|nr:hypothetical protein AVEN_50457-1 [Araneus ventricosus]